MSEPTPEAVEAVAEGIADAHNDGMEARDPYWRHSLPTKSQDWAFEAEAALAFIRDAIHRDGDDADAVREALGLRVVTVTTPTAFSEPRPGGGYIVKPTGERVERRVVGEWREDEA